MFVLAAFAPARAETVNLAVAKPDSPRLFQLCDGYGAPNRNGDGILKMASGWLGIFLPEPASGTTAMNLPAFSRQGIDACTAALGNAERLLPAYHVRRASLLRARAIHRLSAQDWTGASADIDESDAEIAQDNGPLLSRSLGLGNRLLRAYVALQSGQGDLARSQAQVAAQARPYVQSIQKVASAIVLGAGHDADAFYRALDAQARFDPDSRRLLLQFAMDRQDWAKVVATRAQIDLTPPLQKQAGFALADYDRTLAVAQIDAFALDGRLAFAQAVLGHDQESGTLLADMEARLVPWATDLPNLPDGTRPPRLQRNAHEILRSSLPRFNAYLAGIRADIALLAKARAGDGAAVAAAFKAGKAPGDGRGLAILLALRANLHDSAGQADLDRLIASIRQRLAHTSQTIGLPDLYAAVPAPETPERLPRYASSKNIWIGNGIDGFHLAQEGPVIRLDFAGADATAPVVEEMALLKAADVTLAAGKDRFVLLTRTITARTLYQAGSALPVGHVATLRFISFGAEGLPPAFAAYAPVAISARDVMAALASVYGVGGKGQAQ